MTTATMTDKHRRALDAMEAARSQGLSLTEYARVQRLVVERSTMHWRHSAGAVCCPKPSRKARSKFVAVRVAQPVAVTMPTTQRS